MRVHNNTYTTPRRATRRVIESIYYRSRSRGEYNSGGKRDKGGGKRDNRGGKRDKGGGKRGGQVVTMKSSIRHPSSVRLGP